MSRSNRFLYRDISHPHLISITPIYDREGCANTVVATSKTTVPNSSEIWITAKDKTTGDTLRCDAKVGSIDSLQILTNTRHINVDDINILEVQAFDRENNVFSTVEGLKFKWRIEENPQSLRQIPIKEAHFKTSDKKHEMEKKRLMTDITLLKGLKTGVSVVSVQLIEEGSEQVNKASITLSVIEPFLLDPPHPVYILPNSEFQFRILRKRIDSTFFQVKLPSDDFVFFSDNEELGTIVDDGMFHSGDKKATVTVSANDTAIISNTAQNLVHIVPPDQLEMEIFDITENVSQFGLQEYAERVFATEKSTEIDNIRKNMLDIHDNSWILVEERYYLVNMFLFDQARHKIELTNNLKFKLALDEEFVEVFDTNKVHTSRGQTTNQYIIKAKKVILRTKATGKLAEVESFSEYIYNFDYERLIVERGIQITSQVKISHPTPTIRLPYLGYYKENNKAIEKQLWHLPSFGGTGSYKWQSLDETVALVKSSKAAQDIGEVRGNSPGHTTVKVQDAYNPFNYATIVVDVTLVGTFSWLEEKVEVQKGGQTDFTHLIAYDEHGYKFTNCSSLIYSMTVRKEDQGIVELNSGKMSWNTTHSYLQEIKDLLVLRKRFDENMDVVYETDLPVSYKFDEDLELHNNFGICGSDKFTTEEEGLARVKVSLPINYDSARYSHAVDIDTLQIASYVAPHTESPDYKDFFVDLRYPREPAQNKKLFNQYYQNDVFKISYGSSLYWVFNGGTNYWADDIYSLDFSVSNKEYGLGATCLSENLPPLANRVTYQFTCENSGISDLKKYDISIAMRNKVTRSLLKPKLNHARLTLHCAVPKSVDLWWAQQDKGSHTKLQNMPESVLENNEKTYFLRNNQNKHMRALVFDEDKQVIFNTTSLVIDFSADLPKKLEFEAVSKNHKSLAKFQKETGIVYARVDVTKDIFGNKAYNVFNTKKIKLIEQVKINPDFQTRYLHRDNLASFYIVDGSNNFKVQANSTFNHLSDINTIEMTPVTEGLFQVTVEDIGVETVETASAKLLVSDIYRIELSEGGLIEQGSRMNLTMKVYDSQNNLFDQDQLKYMDIKAEIEKVGTSRREGLELIRINDDTFTAYGVESGNYIATLVACKKNNVNDRVSSNYVRIHVFDVVKLVPESILLFPGGRWTIQVDGGPHGGSTGSVYREYEVEDKNICEIDEFGEVHAKHVGETWLSLNMYYKSNNLRTLLASRKTKIRVALITAIEIPMMNERSVFVNSLTRLNIKLKHKKETFLHAIGPLSFDWDTSSSHVYSLSLPSKKDSKGGSSSTNLVTKKSEIWNGETRVNEEFVTNFNYSSIVGVANKNGDARINVKMAIEYPKEYKHEKNFFEDTVRVRVTDKLTMEVPEFIEYPTKQPHIYVLPPLAKNKIVTNKDAKVKLAYSIQTGIHYDTGYECDGTGDDVILNMKDHTVADYDNPILKIHKNGYIETLDKYGKATVVIEENQSFENQIVMLNIMVSQIYSLSIEKPYTALNLPMGSETNLKITFQEENARSFANEVIGVDLFLENSHPHIVKASLDYYNSTINLIALGIGEANIRVYTKDNIFDILRVRVMSSIVPHSPVQLHVGGTVQFVFEDKETPASAKWTSSDNAILAVDPVYGKVEARAEGEAKVNYEGNVNLVSVVNVKKVERIELDATTKPEFFTNAKSNKYYKEEHHLLLNVYLEDGLSEVLPEVYFGGKPLIKSNVKITCETENKDFAVTFAKTINNRYACVLRPTPDSNPTGKIPNTITIIVRATSQQSVTYATEERFEIPFVSFFKINHPAKNVNFYADERFKSLEVIANTDFDVDIEGNSDLVSYKIQEKHNENHYEVQFSVPSSVTQEFRDLKVRISNALTDSSETYYLSYYSQPRSSYSHAEEASTPIIDPVTPHDGGAASNVINMLIAFLLCSCVLIGLVYYCCCINSSDRPDYVFSDSSPISSNSRDNMYSASKGKKSGGLRYSRYHNRHA